MKFSMSWDLAGNCVVNGLPLTPYILRRAREKGNAKNEKASPLRSGLRPLKLNYSQPQDDEAVN